MIFEIQGFIFKAPKSREDEKLDYLYDDTGFFEDAKPMGHCEFCGSSLYQGEIALFLPSDNAYFCDNECLHHYLDIEEEEM